ncbi:MAG: hypothetical protein KAI61_06825 [Alphaproteobacteria bacterium]|nr:hypothetical protein [Alphaproteobacteria bacterium]MCK5658524.1 hypothetical protein [Alphaproteobacteria bacterium]
MNNSSFNILEAVRNAYSFTRREWRYLLKAGYFPMMAQILTSSILQFGVEDISPIESYLLSFPATVLFAWYVFLETRMLLLGERLDRLPSDSALLADRRQAMKVSVIVYLLFSMGMAAADAYLVMAMTSGHWGVNWPITLIGLFVLGGIFWGIRFSVVPILASVNYPVRPVLRQMKGMMFSLRLIGMGIICLLPLIFIFLFPMAIFIVKIASPMTQMKQGFLIVLGGAPVSLIIVTLLNASIAYALKQMLGSSRNGSYR